MVYGIPESSLVSIEKQNTNQFFKCVDCAIDGLDEIINSVYIVKGTVLCLRHAKEAREIKITIQPAYSDPNTGPAGYGYVTLD